MSYEVSIDIGGTFTDLMAIDRRTGEVKVGKAPSHPDNPAQGVIEVIERAELAPDDIALLVHGTTVLTNALIERRGARTGYVTNKGFKDVIFVQRGDKKHLYNLHWKKPKPLVKRLDCAEVTCRINSRGRVIEELDVDELRREITRLKEQGVQAIAVCFLFAYLNAVHELQAAEIIQEVHPECEVSLSHEVYRRWKEYERASTTIADVHLKGLFKGYVSNLEQGLRRSCVKAPFLIMKSNGGVMDSSVAGSYPVRCIASGPVGGVIGAQFFSDLTGTESFVTMDIGGTSCDVCLVQNNAYHYDDRYEIDWGIPIRSPMVSVTSVGAGGGSIARVDSGGLLHVGPQSAGADPGPACYENGGIEPTVTDANLFLKRINPAYFCGGTIPLKPELTEKAVSALAERLPYDEIKTAEAIIQLTDHNMANAIRLISVQKGIDVREFTLVAFGGAGGLHAGAVAQILGMPRVVIPLFPGNISAFGLLKADLRVDQAATVLLRSDDFNIHTLNELLRSLRHKARLGLHEEGYSGDHYAIQKLEMRYLGQNYFKEVEIPDKDALDGDDMTSTWQRFHEIHQEFYGYANLDDIIEIVGLNLTFVGPREAVGLSIRQPAKADAKEVRQVFFGEKCGWQMCPVYERDDLGAAFESVGPAIVEEPFSTTLVHPEQRLRTDDYGNLIVDF